MKVRDKGIAFEKWVARELRAVFPDAKRHLEFQKHTCFGVDIDGTDPYFIQCKRNRGYAPISAIEEVQTDVIFGDVPVLVTRGDGKPAMAVLPFVSFIQLLKGRT